MQLLLEVFFALLPVPSLAVLSLPALSLQDCGDGQNSGGTDGGTGNNCRS